jgi:chorismate dehydratase
MTESCAIRAQPDREAASTRRNPVTRLGDIAFLNCFPIRWGLRSGSAGAELALQPGRPERLAELLLNGELDISPVSLVRYLGNTDDLLLLPGLAIASDGPVRSCHIVSAGPLAGLDGRDVALSRESRSTALLARILLEDAIGVRPRYRHERQHLGTMLGRADAAVIIGDDALRVTVMEQKDLTVNDVGELWRDWTGLPMVFAVWAVRRDFAERHPDQVRAAHAALLDAIRRARLEPAAVAGAASRESGRGDFGALSRDVLLDYYRHLDYSLTERHLMAIRRFARHGAARGEIPEDAAVAFAPNVPPAG